MWTEVSNMKREMTEQETDETYTAEVLIAAYQKQGKHTVKFPVYISETAMQTDIEALDLKPRSFNSLKRAGIRNIGELMESVETTQDLLMHRNLGQKSAVEIMYKIYLYQYRVLSPGRKDQYLKEVIQLNK